MRTGEDLMQTCIKEVDDHWPDRQVAWFYGEGILQIIPGREQVLLQYHMKLGKWLPPSARRELEM
eukprot:1143104-Pelagomonas_calceolata.AAC.3